MPAVCIYVGYLGAALWEVMSQVSGPSIRLIVDPQRVHDPHYIGNALADSINKALDLELCGHGMPWQYHLALLGALPQLPANTSLALFNADYAPDLATAARQLDNLKLYLHCAQTVPDAFAAEPQIGIGVAQPSVLRTYESSEPALSQFEGRMRLGQFDLALTSICGLPGQLLSRLDEVALRLMSEGRVVTLLEQLNALPLPYRQHPRVLRWRLSSAIELWRFDEVLPEVEAAIGREGQPDPELMAYHALAMHHLGRHDAARASIERVAQQEASPLILTIAAQVYQDRRLATAQTYLQLALEKVEASHQPLLKARIGVLLSEVAFQRLEPDRALHWAEWALRVLEQSGINLVPLRIQALLLSTTARLYTDDRVGLEEQLRREAEGLAAANPRMRNLFDATRSELFMVQGRVAEAVEILGALWQRLKQRESLAMYGPTFVRALLEQGQTPEALRVARQVEVMNEQSHPTLRAKAALCRLMVEALGDPAGAVEELEQIAAVFREHDAGCEYLLTDLHLARAYLASSNPRQAERLMQQHGATLSRYGKGLRAFVGPSSAFAELLAPYLGEERLEMEFLGGISARLNGRSLNLPQKQADALVALALHPEGLGVQKLALALYGEEGILNSAHKVMARLKPQVPVKANPYALAVEYSADFLEVKRCLAAGDVRGALRYYRGHLLPLSESPMVTEERLALEEMLRAAALQSGDGEAIYIVATLYKDDLELWEGAVGYLPKIDPRHALAEAQRRTLAKTWN